MTEYTDVPTVNALYTEAELVNTAIAMIDEGTGTLTNFTIGPIPYVPEPPVMRTGGAGPSTRTDPVPTPTGPPMMPVNVVVPGPVDPQLLVDIRAALVTRATALNTELAGLGVTSPPALGTMSRRFQPFYTPGMPAGPPGRGAAFPGPGPGPDPAPSA